MSLSLAKSGSRLKMRVALVKISLFLGSVIRKATSRLG